METVSKIKSNNGEELIIRQENEKDYFSVENLTREAFWNVYRPGCSEHYVLHKFRNSNEFVKKLDFVMEKDGNLIGHIMYVRSEILCDDGTSFPIMTFGPISILPKEQRKGYGTTLLEFSMEKAKELNAKALAITGNIDFYSRFGFTVAKSQNIRYADDFDAEYFLIKELEDGALDGITGIYKDPTGYFVKDEEVEEFDKLFPSKVKEKKDTQLSW